MIQVNAFHGGLRAAAIATANSIAAQCDGLRCDMAMLMLNDVFGRAWSARAGRTLPTEYWQDLIPAVKARYQDVLFIAEACWDLEYELMQKGFDYCYDKRLYDRLVHDDAVPRGFFPLLNAGELAIIYCFVFLYLAVAGGGVWSLDHLRAGNKASRAAWRT